jgi:hypothetical protein
LEAYDGEEEGRLALARNVVGRIRKSESDRGREGDNGRGIDIPG